MKFRNTLIVLLVAISTPFVAYSATNPLFDFGSSGSVDSSSGSEVDYATSDEVEEPAVESGLPLGIDEQVSVKMLPSVPKPGDSVFIRIDSYSTNLNKAATSWQEDGVTMSEGMGMVEFRFVAPNSGESKTIVFRAIKETGGVIEKTFTISPADVDILYEALTYTPAFYKGKSLFTNSSQIKFVAVPNVVVGGVRVNPKELVYTWRENGKVIQSASGYGKQEFTTRGTLVTRGINIEVEVEAVNSPVKTTAKTYVGYISPLVLLYQKDPLLGVRFEKSWSDATNQLFGTEFSLIAIPYFADANSVSDPQLAYSWRVNNESSSQSGPVVTFRKDGGGKASVGVTLKHLRNFAQYALSSASVDLGEILPTGAVTI